MAVQSDELPWAAFVRVYPLVLPAITKGFEHLSSRLQTVEDKQGDLRGVVSVLLVAALRDMDSILTLGCHNKIIGAHQLFRSLFEKIVVAKYLTKNPLEVENFLDFDAIHWTRTMDRIKGITGLEMSAESAANLRARNEQARKKFRQSKCPSCNRVPQLSWTAKDTETLAKEIGLGDRYLFCFLEPTQLLHCTWYGMSNFGLQDSQTRLSAILEALHVLLITAIMLHEELYGPAGSPNEETSLVYLEWRQAWAS